MPVVGTILVAAGSSERAGGATPKQFVKIGSAPMFVAALASVLPHSDEVVVVAPRSREAEAEKLVAESRILREERFASTVVTFVPGGKRRQDSVRKGLAALSGAVEIVLVHDAARPFASEELVARVVAAAASTGAAVPAVAVPDTVKRVEGDVVVDTLDRSALRLIQTPQGFRREVLVAAYEALEDLDVTDDARAVELAGGKVAVVQGEPGNAKVTTAHDLEAAVARANAAMGLGRSFRTGTGRDTHRLVAGRELVLCGVAIPFDKGLDGHSDADVATHAVCDALLGAVAEGDIGVHFPPGDPAFKDVSSLLLLTKVVEIVSSRGFRIENVDVTIVAEAPRLAPHVATMRETLAGTMGVDVDAVSVKATTTEGTGPEGTGDAISSDAVAVVSGEMR